MPVEFFRTARFDAWLRKLRDPGAKGRILARIRAAQLGNFGDHRPVAAGVHEMRVHVGPGYRVYYCRLGRDSWLLLCGGAKATQRNDIRTAITMRRNLEE